MEVGLLLDLPVIFRIGNTVCLKAIEKGLKCSFIWMHVLVGSVCKVC